MKRDSCGASDESHAKHGDIPYTSPIDGVPYPTLTSQMLDVITLPSESSLGVTRAAIRALSHCHSVTHIPRTELATPGMPWCGFHKSKEQTFIGLFRCLKGNELGGQSGLAARLEDTGLLKYLRVEEAGP